MISMNLSTTPNDYNPDTKIRFVQESRSNIEGTTKNNKKLIPSRVTTPRNQEVEAKHAIAQRCLSKIRRFARFRKKKKKKKKQMEEK